MIDIAIVAGSTRPGRRALQIAHWVRDLAGGRGDAGFEVVDLADYELPHLDEPRPPAMGGYVHLHTRRWASTVDRYDGYVFVTPEYNRSMPGVLKNAIDFLGAEWEDKAAGFVGYGADGGTRAVEQLRLVVGGLGMADVKSQVALSLFADFDEAARFTPRPHQEARVAAMLDQVVSWGAALRALSRSALRQPA